MMGGVPLAPPDGMGKTVSRRVAVPGVPELLDALKLTLLVPAVIGVPLIIPENGSQLRPLGNPVAPKSNGEPVATIW